MSSCSNFCALSQERENERPPAGPEAALGLGHSNSRANDWTDAPDDFGIDFGDDPITDDVMEEAAVWCGIAMVVVLLVVAVALVSG
jgi:hypothetical protein